MREFAANANDSEFTKLASFFVSKGYHPRMSFDEISTENMTARDRIEAEKAEDFSGDMEQIWDYCNETMKNSAEAFRNQSDRRRQEGPVYKIGDLVWLSTRNIKTDRPAKKLEHKNLGPFKIIMSRDPVYKLDLPDSMRIHPVFHKSLPRPAATDPLPGQTQLPAEPVIINGQREWEVVEILDAKVRYRKLQFRVACKDYPSDMTWYDATNFENSADIVEDFYRRHPEKPYWRGPRP